METLKLAALRPFACARFFCRKSEKKPILFFYLDVRIRISFAAQLFFHPVKVPKRFAVHYFSNLAICWSSLNHYRRLVGIQKPKRKRGRNVIFAESVS